MRGRRAPHRYEHSTMKRTIARRKTPRFLIGQRLGNCPRGCPFHRANWQKSGAILENFRKRGSCRKWLQVLGFTAVTQREKQDP